MTAFLFAFATPGARPVATRASAWLPPLAFALALACGDVWAQSATSASVAQLPTLNVEQLTRLVLDHNPQLRAARSTVDAAQAGITSASALRQAIRSASAWGRSASQARDQRACSGM